MQLHERHVGAELAQNWGPSLVQEIEKLKTRMASVERGKFEMMNAKSDAAPKEPASADSWFQVTMTRVKRVPDLLVVRSEPLVDRMQTTVAEKKVDVKSEKL